MARAAKGKPAPKRGRRGKRLPNIPAFEGDELPEGSAEIKTARGGPGRGVGGGRPSDYHAKYCEIAAELYSDGATDIEVADAIGINVATLYRWRAKHLTFREASDLGKQAADKRVERSLFNRAVGYSYDSVKVFQFEGSPVIVPIREHVPPDVGAAKHWLANRDRENWSKAAEGNLTADAAFVEMLKMVSGER